MDYFKINKHQSIDENVLYISSILYKLLEGKKHVDELFFEYAQSREITLNLNVEKSLYLALTFLYAVGKIRVNNNIILRS